MDDALVPYTYDLPRDRIAQRPAHPPESARMLVVDSRSGEVQHSDFSRIACFLRRGDHLVFNETKVLPARLFGALASQPGSEVDVLLVEQQGPQRWLCLGRPLRKIKAEGRLVFGDKLRAVVVPSGHVDRVVLDFEACDGSSSVAGLMHEVGTMPIPPYIRSGHGDEQDRKDYQSVFARHEGSIAAPTASLHFTESLVAQLRTDPGADVSTVTLHVGTASFQPVLMDGALRAPAREHFEVRGEVLQGLKESKARGHRVIAVGTTVTRALETAARSSSSLEKGGTELFIKPGFEFTLVDVLVTNFHQPGTTHLLLVEALLGRSLVAKCYEEALREGYRFLSYGDGMLIL